jgi:hypothetical protein
MGQFDTARILVLITATAILQIRESGRAENCCLKNKKSLILSLDVIGTLFL